MNNQRRKRIHCCICGVVLIRTISDLCIECAKIYVFNEETGEYELDIIAASIDRHKDRST